MWEEKPTPTASQNPLLFWLPNKRLAIFGERRSIDSKAKKIPTVTNSIKNSNFSNFFLYKRSIRSSIWDFVGSGIDRRSGLWSPENRGFSCWTEIQGSLIVVPEEERSWIGCLRRHRRRIRQPVSSLLVPNIPVVILQSRSVPGKKDEDSGWEKKSGFSIRWLEKKNEKVVLVGLKLIWL